MTVGYLFAGQGQQTAQMGQDLYQQEAVYRDVVNEAADALAVDLRNPVVFGAPQNAQVAIYTMSVGIARVLAQELPVPAGMLGLSLGEYAALTAAGSLTLADGVQLVADRARYMAAAGQAVPGKMAAVMTDRQDEVRRLLQTIDGVYVANNNTASQLVVGGREEAVDTLVAQLKQQGIKRAMTLKVVASHTPLMQPAAEQLANRLASVPFGPTTVPVISNTTVQPFVAGTVKGTLVRQLTHPTHFGAGLQALSSLGVDRFVEVGPGHTLSSFVKQTLPNAERYHVSDIASLNEVRGALVAKS